MPEHDREPRLGLTPAQVAGSALAAISGAVVASWFGTAGTIIGAALASVIATIGTEAYTWSLRRTGHAVKNQAVRVRQRVPGTVETPPDPTDGPAHRDDDARRFPWPRVAAATVVVLVIALGGVTAFEALTGRPVSSLLGRDDDTGTTLGHVVHRKPRQQHSPAQPDGSSGPQPSSSSSPSKSPESPLGHVPSLGGGSSSSP